MAVTPVTETDLAPYLMILSGLFHAIVNAILKAGKDKLSARALIDSFSAILVLPAAFFVDLPSHAWVYLLLSWVVHLVYLISLVKAFERLDMTVAYPIARGIAPMLASAGAILFLGEPITQNIVIGILLVSGGVAAIGVTRKVHWEALGWSVLTGLCIALYTVIDAKGVRVAPTAISYIVWVFMMLGFGIGGLFALWRGKDFVLAASEQWKPGLVAGGFSLATYGLALFAMKWGAVPRLAALRETSIVFAGLIAYLFLKERISSKRAGGMILIALGAMWLLATK